MNRLQVVSHKAVVLQSSLDKFYGIVHIYDVRCFNALRS